MAKTKLGPEGKKHVAEVMNRFASGRLLRSSDGTKLSPSNPQDRKRAAAIAYSEAKAGEERGFGRRTWKGSTRVRQNKAKK